ncbi:hypothetical protein [Pollutimonas harenae]|uniref:Uncharacterized protein n=1 Tax=Pollutimonas harenae TaxID=657015 RepID=A0A853H059_9BURK|nr:hypothetical protein [Pollutimonas harenae]NYT86366.1 hypothetical protein [Pollutimonas harenae]TEA69876.1 hypothetical protein ERD84_14205 [Pollutimonas harenae]
MSRYAEVVEGCRRAGMAVERELVAIGIIAGTIEVSRVQELYKIAGVRDVEPSRSNYRLDTPQNQKS